MTHGEVIILRLLNRRDLYGYELDQLIEEHRMRQWANIGFSSIYHILKKLESTSLVGSYYVKEQGSPQRKVFQITEAGRKALHGEVMEMLKKPEDPHDDFTVALVTSDILSEREFRESLAAYRRHLERKREFFRHEIPRRSREKERVAMAIERWMRLTEAEMEWLDELQ